MAEAIIAVVAVLVGVTVGWALGRRAGGGAELATARAEVAGLRERLTLDAAAAAEREQRLIADHARYVEQVRGDHDRLAQQFKALSADALKANQEAFLAIANERLARTQLSHQEELEKRERAVRQLVEPMRETLEKVEKQTSEADRARATGHAQLSEQVRAMLDASAKLDKRTTDFINTLRRSDVRGNWGEVQLRRVVELAGMVEHVDFTEQDSVRDGEGRLLRPDMTVQLAGGRTIVVDSKVALTALIEAFEADDEGVRTERLRAHARHIKKHVDDLAAKRYWDQFASAPEFVVMFVPSEAFYQAALEQDPDLQEYAYAKRVFIATPTTLVAMLRTVAHAWKEDALAKNAQAVLATGKELYDRLSTMGEHLSKVGRAIESAGKAYNQTVASMESRVMVSARRFGDMQHIDHQLDEVQQVTTEVRELSAPELTQQSLPAPREFGDDDAPDAAHQTRQFPERLAENSDAPGTTLSDS